MAQVLMKLSNSCCSFHHSDSNLIANTHAISTLAAASTPCITLRQCCRHPMRHLLLPASHASHLCIAAGTHALQHTPLPANHAVRHLLLPATMQGSNCFNAQMQHMRHMLLKATDMNHRLQPAEVSAAVTSTGRGVGYSTPHNANYRFTFWDCHIACLG